MTRPATQTYVAKVVSQTSSSAPTVITTTMTVTRTVAISATPYKTTAAPRRAVVNMSQLLPIPNFNLPLNLNLF